jgi:capsular polysaccharide biosynthesis protein
MLSGLRLIEKPKEKVDVYLPWLKDTGFQTDSLRYFEDKFNFLKKEDEVQGRTIVKFNGEIELAADRIADEGYTYIREKLLGKTHYTMIPKKYVYISRKKSTQLVSNLARKKPLHHSVINEEELIIMLSGFGFQTVCLEDLNFHEKLRLFCEAEIIISPFGGSLVPCIVSSAPQKIIELVDFTVHLTGWRHYKIICEKTGAHHYTYADINYSDADFNIHLKLDKLFELLKQLTK